MYHPSSHELADAQSDCLDDLEQVVREKSVNIRGQERMRGGDKGSGGTLSSWQQQVTLAPSAGVDTSDQIIEEFERRRVLVRGRKEGSPHTSASKEAMLQTTSALLQTTSGDQLSDLLSHLSQHPRTLTPAGARGAGSGGGVSKHMMRNLRDSEAYAALLGSSMYGQAASEESDMRRMSIESPSTYARRELHLSAAAAYGRELQHQHQHQHQHVSPDSSQYVRELGGCLSPRLVMQQQHAAVLSPSYLPSYEYQREFVTPSASPSTAACCPSDPLSCNSQRPARHVHPFGGREPSVHSIPVSKLSSSTASTPQQQALLQEQRELKIELAKRAAFMQDIIFSTLMPY